MALTSVPAFVIMVIVTMDTVAMERQEVSVDRLGDDWDKIGVITPGEFMAHIPLPVKVTCSVRRMILEKYDLQSTDIYFRLHLQSNEEEVIPSQKVSYPRPKNPDKIPNRAVVEHLFLKLRHDRAWLRCMLRVNASHEVLVDQAYLYVGFLPAQGIVENVITTDLETITITYSKTHPNPIYITNFMVMVRLSPLQSVSNTDYRRCEAPFGEMIDNDTCRFNVSGLKKLNGLVEVFVRSSNLDRFTTDGPVESFYLYSKYKPVAVQVVNVSNGNSEGINQSAPSVVLRWNYPTLPFPLMFDVYYQCTLDNQIRNAQNMTGYYQKLPLQVTLQNLYWGARYTYKIIVKPGALGYTSDTFEGSFITPENVPARNPEILPGMFERTVRDDGSQDVTIYWKPIPEIYSNGYITETKVMVIPYDQSNDQSPHIIKISDPSVTQLIVRDLQSDLPYGFTITAATKKGYNDMIRDVLHVSQLGDGPVAMETHNLTVLVDGETDTSNHSILVTWATTDTPPGWTNQSLVWCVRHGLEGLCDPKTPLKYVTLPGQQSEYQLYLDDDVYRYKFGIATTTEKGSSGIQWNPCLYDKTKVAPPPKRNGEPQKHKHGLTLHLSQPPCSTLKGYPYGYRVVYNSTENDHQEQIFLDTSLSHYTVDNLKSSKVYDITVHSLSAAGQSTTSLRIDGVKTLRIRYEICISVTIGCLVLVAFFTVIVVRFQRRLKKTQEVVVPEIPEEMLNRRQSPDGGQPEEGSDPHRYTPLHHEEPVQYPDLKEKERLITSNNVVQFPVLQVANINLRASDTPMLVLSTRFDSPCEYSDEDASCGDGDHRSLPGDFAETSSLYRQGSEHSVVFLQTSPPANHRQVMAERSGFAESDRGTPSPPVPAQSRQSEPSPSPAAQCQQGPLRSLLPTLGSLDESSDISSLEPGALPQSNIGLSQHRPEINGWTETKPQCASRGSSIENYPKIGYRSDADSAIGSSHQAIPEAIKDDANENSEEERNLIPSLLTSFQDVAPLQEQSGDLVLELKEFGNEDDDDEDDDVDGEDDEIETSVTPTPESAGQIDPYSPAQKIHQRPSHDDERPRTHESRLLQRPESGFYSPEPSPAITLGNICPAFDDDEEEFDDSDEDSMPDEGILSLTDTDQYTRVDSPYRPGITQNQPPSTTENLRLDLSSHYDQKHSHVPCTIYEDDGYSRGLEVSMDVPVQNQNPTYKDPYSRGEVIR